MCELADLCEMASSKKVRGSPAGDTPRKPVKVARPRKSIRKLYCIVLYCTCFLSCAWYVIWRGSLARPLDKGQMCHTSSDEYIWETCGGGLILLIGITNVPQNWVHFGTLGTYVGYP